MLIGISGKKFVGKDSFAGLLMEACGAQEVPLSTQSMAFADALKQVASNISGVPIGWFYDPKRKEVVHPCCGKSPRKIMEEANAVFKKCWGDDVFVRPVARAFSLSSADVFMATDVRFEVEADWVRSEGGVVVHLLRDTGYSSFAKSEQGVVVRDGDIVVVNESTLETLRIRAFAILSSLLSQSVLQK